MKLVEEVGIGRQVRLEPVADLFVARMRGDQTMAGEDASGVRVDDEHGAAGRVEQDRVGGLGPETRDLEQAGAERTERHRPHPPQSSVQSLEDPAGQRLEPASLHALSPGRANDPGEAGHAEGRQPFGRQAAAGSERRDRPGGVDPGGVLGEDRANGDLVRRAARPPALRAVAPAERLVEAQKTGLGAIARRTGRPAAPRT